MAEFVVKLADERGRIQEQVQVANSAEELRNRFSQAGYYVYSVKPRGLRGGGAEVGGRWHHEVGRLHGAEAPGVAPDHDVG